MRIRKLHSFNVPYDEAVRIQRELSERISFSRLPSSYRYVAGADVAYSKKDSALYAAIVVLEYPSGKEVVSHMLKGAATFPYIPGLLSFREAPLLLRAFEEIPVPPDVVMFDGQGIAHPRGVGLACHVGLFLDVPSIGCAKSRLVGEHEQPGEKRGSRAPLLYKDKTVGAVVRTKDRVRPVFVSPGHKVDIEGSVRVVLETFGGYRLPEPTRLAHLLSQKAKREL